MDFNTAVRRVHSRRLITGVLGVALMAGAVVYLTTAVRPALVGEAAAAMAAQPAAIGLALTAYAAAFALRAWAWRRVLPALSGGQAWAALHVSLLGNHVLPLRLGEALRVTSVLRRTSLDTKPVVVSALALRVGDVVAVGVLALVAAPAVLVSVAGPWTWPVLGAGLAGLAGCLYLVRRTPSLRLPGPAILVVTLLAWVLESAVVYAVASAAGHPIGAGQAVAVTAVTIAAQTVAMTPGGVGTYEAAATAALVALGVGPGAAFAVALLTHAVKTGYALLIGGIALLVPGPGYFGRWRLPRRLPSRPAPAPLVPDAPVVAIIPVHNEAETIAKVVSGLPREVGGRRVEVIVVDDGSADDSAVLARDAGATVASQPRNLGLGAAVRRGLAEASARGPAAVVYLDADLEYDPTQLGDVAAPVLAGAADYVVGSRFSGQISRMLPHRRLGNRVLTLWVRWLTRRSDLTDGQSGYRAFSPRAAAEAEIIHDYNYAQVLTLDLLGKGFVYAEVGIRYSFRDTGTSFVRLGRYLRRVVPAVHRELNAPAALSESPAG